MATRPGEPYIAEALDSIAAQTQRADHIIVVVNGPGAVDGAFASTLARDFPEVEVRALERPGMSGALAHALADVSTRYVAFLDADDLWEPDKQRRQLAHLAEDPSLHAVSCRTVNFRRDDTGVTADENSAVARVFSATTFRTEAFTRYGLPDPAADHFAWLYRWWASAHTAGIVAAGEDFVGLRRRVHAANGWVAEHAKGRSVLLAELRRIERERRAAQAGPRHAATP